MLKMVSSVGVTMWLIGNVGGCEYVFQGLDADGYCMAGRCAACLSSSGDLVRVPDRMPCYSRMPPVPCAHMLSDAVHDLRTTRVRYQHGVVRMRLYGELCSPPQSVGATK